LPKVKSRAELLEKLAKKFGVKPTTINSYFSLRGFKTGFFRHNQIPHSSFEVLKKLQERPRFNYELNNKEINVIHQTLKRYGLVKIFRFGHRSKGKTSRFGKKMLNNKVIYYLPHQNFEAFRMLKETFSTNLNKNKRNILKALGIPYFMKNGKYYKLTGEEL